MTPESQQRLVDLFGINASQVLCRGDFALAIAAAAKSHNLSVRFINPPVFNVDEIVGTQSNQAAGLLTALRRTLRIQDTVHALVFERLDEYDGKQASLIKQLLLGEFQDETGKDFDFVWATMGAGRELPRYLGDCFVHIIEP